MTKIALDPLDLAALLCSRVCHDVISPVGAIANGLEMLEDEKDPEMRAMAFDLVKKSSAKASAQLQFCRLAFGAAGSAGADIDSGDAQNVANGLLADDRTRLNWQVPRAYLPKNKVKLLLNLCLIASKAIPRGGLIDVMVSGAGDKMSATVEASGPNLRLAQGVSAILEGFDEAVVDAHSIQPYYTALVAQAANMQVKARAESDKIVFEANPLPDTIAMAS
eukprot:gene8226-8310_t